MSHAITLDLPDRLYEPIRRIAEAINQPLEALLVIALQASLPPLDGLPEDIAKELVQLEALDDGALADVMYETVPAHDRDELQDLLGKNQAGEMTDEERERLLALVRSADRIMLRKARAAVLLRFRGRRIPTAAELAERSAAA